MKKLFSFILLCTIMLSGCTISKSVLQKNEVKISTTRSLQSMDTIMQITAFGANREAALDSCEEEIWRLNNLLSTGLESSEVSKLNRTGHAIVSDDCSVLIHKALELYNSTDGAFDISVYPLTQLWGFSTKEFYVPNEEEIKNILPHIGAKQIKIHENEVTLGSSQSIDLGGIAKGYTSQRLMEIFTEHGVQSAMVSLGGNVQCLGTKPDGQKWKIGIQSPWKNQSGVYAVVQVENEAVITSGGYERFFEDPQTRKVYRHILDASTGYPAESGLASVSIVTPDGTLGDGLSTALYVMGLERAVAYWQQYFEEFEIILITDDGDLYVSEGLKDRVTSIHSINIIPYQQKEDSR